jgi:hypothetical protein
MPSLEMDEEDVEGKKENCTPLAEKLLFECCSRVEIIVLQATNAQHARDLPGIVLKCTTSYHKRLRIANTLLKMGNFFEFSNLWDSLGGCDVALPKHSGFFIKLEEPAVYFIYLLLLPFCSFCSFCSVSLVFNMSDVMRRPPALVESEFHRFVLFDAPDDTTLPSYIDVYLLFSSLISI